MSLFAGIRKNAWVRIAILSVLLTTWTFGVSFVIAGLSPLANLVRTAPIDRSDHPRHITDVKRLTVQATVAASLADRAQALAKDYERAMNAFLPSLEAVVKKAKSSNGDKTSIANGLKELVDASELGKNNPFIRSDPIEVKIVTLGMDEKYNDGNSYYTGFLWTIWTPRIGLKFTERNPPESSTSNPDVSGRLADAERDRGDAKPISLSAIDAEMTVREFQITIERDFKKISFAKFAGNIESDGVRFRQNEPDEFAKIIEKHTKSGSGNASDVDNNFRDETFDAEHLVNVAEEMRVVSRSWWKFAGGALRAGDCWPCQAARSRVAGWIG